MTEVEVELNRVRNRLGRVADSLQTEIDRNKAMRELLDECRSELCLKCGKVEGQGECDGCQWWKLKYGGFDDIIGN